MRRPPIATRPDPKGYFQPSDQGAGLLDWGAAVEKLVAARNYWVATASASGVPHSMPVWGIWNRDSFWFSTGPTTLKARNLIENPRAVVHLESAAQLVVVEGDAREVSDADAIEDFLAAYNPKYNWDFTPENFQSGGLFEVRPRKAFAWLGDEGDAFSGTATRWLFPG